jgi:hypothetical protein
MGIFNHHPAFPDDDTSSMAVAIGDQKLKMRINRPMIEEGKTLDAYQVISFQPRGYG